MKNSILFILIVVVTACNHQNDAPEIRVHGMYVTPFETEYSKGMDTIEVIPINKDAGTFRYVRRIGYKRISGGVPGKYEYKVENSTCVFTKNTAQLHEERYGRIYSLSKDGNELVMGQSVYRRIQ